MVVDIIKTIQKQFLFEALCSPLLFNDLANMEKYISESYTGRSLIELLQNADDAGSTRFLIMPVDEKTYIVANDGRPFNDNDILALCRSGASTKHRKGSTIGFRGIGFKSVVNYAECVHLISGEIRTTFSRELTRTIVPDANDVPMIRIPHEFTGHKHLSKVTDLQEQGYTTVFIFEVKSHSLLDEIRNFDIHSMLFLQSVSNIIMNLSTPKEFYTYRKRISDQFWLVTTEEDGQLAQWLVTIAQPDDEKCAVAFKYDGVKIIDADSTEAVVHSFMPTEDSLSIRIKINGDFSTDPSRKKVVIDDDTKHAASLCASIIGRLISCILEEESDEYGVAHILCTAKRDPLAHIRGESVNDIFVSELHSIINKLITEKYGETGLVLQPSEMSEDDFNNIVKYRKLTGISIRLERSIPGLLDLLKLCGIKDIALDDCLIAMNELECSETTREYIILRAINQTRLGMSPNLKEKIRIAKLISFTEGVLPICEASALSVVTSNFEGTIVDSLTSSSDYISFMKVIGLKPEQLALNQKGEATYVHSFSSASIQTETASFTKTNVIKKWRSVEKNVAAVLELMDDVVSVTDVSLQNLGYDLEVLLKNGKKRYYEVKSVESLGEMISITNNEYSTGMHYRKDYYLAIAYQTEDTISICFVPDPINNLLLTKRVTRWEWICNDYQGEVITTKMS